MTEAGLGSDKQLVSDAPLVSDVVRLADGEVGLRRRLHPGWASDHGARQLLVDEIEAAAKVPRQREELTPLIAAETGQEPWLVRRYSPIGTLCDRLVWGGPLTGGELLTVAATTLTALDELWRLGLVHGDPGPHNLLLLDGGRLTLADQVSCRRRYAETGRSSPGHEDRQLDMERFLRWFTAGVRRSAATGSGGDPAVASLLACVASQQMTAEMQHAALWRVIAQEGGNGLPIHLERHPRQETTSPPVTIDVVLKLGPIRDSRTCYWAARRLAPELGCEVGELRRRLATRQLSVPSRHPEPVGSLATELQDAGFHPVVKMAHHRPPVTVSPTTVAPPAAPAAASPVEARQPPVQPQPEETEPSLLRQIGQGLSQVERDLQRALQQMKRSDGPLRYLAAVGELLLHLVVLRPALLGFTTALKELYCQAPSRQTALAVLRHGLPLYGRLLLLHVVLLLLYAVPLNLLFH